MKKPENILLPFYVTKNMLQKNLKTYYYLFKLLKICYEKT